LPAIPFLLIYASLACQALLRARRLKMVIVDGDRSAEGPMAETA